MLHRAAKNNQGLGSCGVTKAVAVTSGASKPSDSRAAGLAQRYRAYIAVTCDAAQKSCDRNVQQSVEAAAVKGVDCRQDVGGNVGTRVAGALHKAVVSLDEEHVLPRWGGLRGGWVCRREEPLKSNWWRPRFALGSLCRHFKRESLGNAMHMAILSQGLQRAGLP